MFYIFNQQTLLMFNGNKTNVNMLFCTNLRYLIVVVFVFILVCRPTISNTLNLNTKLNHIKSQISLWLERWFLSSNAKDIGTLYLIFALLSGLIGTAFSVLIRLELSGPGVQFIADNQLYNSIITAHAIVMIFFMVKFYEN